MLTSCKGIRDPPNRPLLPLATTREPEDGGVEVGESTEGTTTTASESSQSLSPEHIRSKEVPNRQ